MFLLVVFQSFLYVLYTQSYLLDQEKRSALDDLAQAIRILENASRHIGDFTVDYAVWDDTYAFATGQVNEYYGVSLTRESFSNAGISEVLIFDQQYELLLSVGVDSAGESTRPAKSVFVNWATAYLPTLKTAQYGLISGTLLLNHEVYLVSLHPVLPNDASGEPAGWLVMAEVLNQAVFDTLTEDPNFSFRYILPDAPHLSQPVIKALQSDEPVAVALDHDTFGSYQAIETLNQSSLVLETQSNRVLSQALEQTFLLMTGVVVILVAVVGGGVIYLIDRIVLRRLQQVQEDVRHIGETGDLAGRVADLGRDELGELGVDINLMLARLQALDQQRMESEARFLNLVQMEVLLADVSSSFLDQYKGDVSAWLGYVLERLAQYLGVNCIGVYQTRTDSQAILLDQVYNNQSACDEQIPEYIPWTHINLLQQYGSQAEAKLILPGTSSVEESDALDTYFAQYNLASALLIPLMNNEQAIGSMAIINWQEARPWDTNELRLVAVIAEMIAQAFVRQQIELSLQMSEARYRTLFHLIPDGILLVENRTIVMANQAAAELLGADNAQIIQGQSLEHWLSPAEIDAVEAKIDDGTLHQSFVAPVDIRIKQLGGHPVEVEITAFQYSYGANSGVLWLLRDVHLRNLINQEKQYQIRMNYLTSMAASGEDGQMTIQKLADELGVALGADGCYITYWDAENQVPIPGAAYGPYRETYPSLKSKPGERTLTASVVRAEQTLIVEDVLHSLFVSPALAEQFPQKAMLGIPLWMDGKVFGALLVGYNQPRRFTVDEVERAERASIPIALAIKKAQFYDRLRASLEELALAYDATIAGWSRALELRSRETQGHSVRVTEMSVTLAEAMGFDEEQIVHVRRGALLHDIGKMGIPDSILLKPGKLTAEEWEIMKRHTLMAQEMLGNIHFLEPALEIPLYHHEKWDGSGYPYGLAGEAIPLAARIFSVIDVWDALTEKRPYHDPWTLEERVNYLRNNSGTHFDPQVVEAFLHVFVHEQIEQV